MSFGKRSEENAVHWDEILCVQFRTGIVQLELTEPKFYFILSCRIKLDIWVAISKGMRAVKLCCNKILQFFTKGAG